MPLPITNRLRVEIFVYYPIWSKNKKQKILLNMIELTCKSRKFIIYIAWLKKKPFHPIIIFNDTHIFKINMLFLHAVFSGSNAAFSYSLENNLRTLIFTTNSYNRFTRPELQVAVTAELNLLTLTSLVSQLEFFFWWYFFQIYICISFTHLHL